MGFNSGFKGLMKVVLYCQQAGNTTITEGQNFPFLTLSMEIKY